MRSCDNSTLPPLAIGVNFYGHLYLLHLLLDHLKRSAPSRSARAVLCYAVLCCAVLCHLDRRRALEVSAEAARLPHLSRRLRSHRTVPLPML